MMKYEKKKNKTPIIVDVERMKHPYTGLYYYCLNLALHLEKHHSDEFDFHFFSYPGVKLPAHLKRILRKHWDKFYLKKGTRYQLWHTTWQDTKYVPKDRIKYVYTIHDLNFLYTDKLDKKKREKLAAVQSKIDRADAITVISRFVKQDVEKHLDTRGKKIHVIYNGVEVQEFPGFDNPPYRPSRPFLFTVGTVLYKKHFHILPSLLVDNDYELVIAGIHPDKQYIEHIRSEIDKYGVQDRVTLTGPVSAEEKYWYMKHCEAFLFPSISEGFGLPPIEAMRLGKPVFLSTLTSLPEIGGNAAYYFRNFEPEDMRRVLYDGLKDYHTNKRREEIIEWSKRYTWEKAVNEYVKVYRTALGMNALPQSESIKITAIIPTLNEIKHIEEAIRSLEFADEILVIDSMSTDGTPEKAEELGAKVIRREFDDFSSQKNFAIEQATYDWIFVLDADERPTPELVEEIKIGKTDGFDFNAYWIHRINYFHGEIVRFSGWQNDKVIRLFNRNFARYNGKLVHEEIDCDTPTGFFNAEIRHYPVANIRAFRNKLDHYARLRAMEDYNSGLSPSFFHTLIKPMYRFVYHYFIRLGFLDGRRGFLIAKENAASIIKRYKYLKELKRKNDE